MRISILGCFVLLLAGSTWGRELGRGPVPEPLPTIGPRLYQCFQFPDDRVPTMDGDLTDWEIVGDEYVQDIFQLLDFHFDDAELRRTYDPAGLDLRVRTGYNVSANRIYVAAEYYDDFHNMDRLTTAHRQVGHDDIFELVVDADRSGREFVYDASRKWVQNTHAQNYHVYFHEREGNHLWAWGDQVWLEEEPYGKAANVFDGVHGSAGLCVLEFWVTPYNYAHPDGPQFSARAELAAGDTIGMTYAILDFDEVEKDRHFWALADTIRMYCNADFASDFVLAPLEERLSKLPVADFRSRAPSVDAPRSVQFDNRTTGEPTGFVWDFGDGETSAERDPLHRFEAAGTYTVTLEARNQWGSCRKRKVDYVVLPR